ncbi:MAG TPA: ABC transporter substrate-binding protein [Firmicutes bacterium]|nr:ABC transporter substrate-binding protein [Bacillota bacterium]
MMVLLLALLVAGCGGETAGEQKETIIFGDYSWDSSQVHNRVAGFIIEHGYGYPVDYLFGETIPLLQGLQKNNLQVSMEIWVLNIQEAYQAALESGQIVELGKNFEDAPQGWYVPTYMITGNPERGIAPIAPDLRSVTDLPKYWELFKDPENPHQGRFYNSPPGWICTAINEQKIASYGLDEFFAPFATGSDAALISSMVAAYEQGKPWVGYYWEPTWVMGKLDFTMLAEPAYDDALWSDAGGYGCAYPDCPVLKAVNVSLQESAPEVVEFIAHYQTTLEQNNAVLAFMESNQADVAAAALYFLNQYPDVWQQWVPADVAARVSQALNEVH